MSSLYIKTKTLHINASSEKEAIDLALISAPNQVFLDNQFIHLFNEEKSIHYSKSRQSYRPNNNEGQNTNNTFGYNVELTSTKFDIITNKQIYIITGCNKNYKPHLYAHMESNKCATMKIPLYIYTQKNEKIIFHTENILEYVKQKYDYHNTSDEHLLTLIDPSINTTNITNIDMPYDGIIIRNIPNEGPHFFGILFISEQNKDIIINDEMTDHIEKNQRIQEIIVKHNYNLLNNNIQSNSLNKKLLKI